MIEEEKKAEEMIVNFFCGVRQADYTHKETVRLMVKFATQATKELQEENKKIYQRMTGLDKVLECKNEQIEKMKCCFNCKHSRTEYEHCRTDKHEKWELTE